jgi:hypothetical protein
MARGGSRQQHPLAPSKRRVAGSSPAGAFSGGRFGSGMFATALADGHVPNDVVEASWKREGHDRQAGTCSDTSASSRVPRPRTPAVHHSAQPRADAAVSRGALGRGASPKRSATRTACSAQRPPLTPTEPCADCAGTARILGSLDHLARQDHRDGGSAHPAERVSGPKRARWLRCVEDVDADRRSTAPCRLRSRHVLLRAARWRVGAPRRY